MNYDDLQWKDVKELQIKTIGIAETQNSESSAVAVMPISHFQYFLKENADMGFNLKLPQIPNALKDDKYYFVGKEGAKKEVYTTRYERDPGLREEAIRYHGYTCCGCGFNFMDTYGIEYIEVHHKKPLSTFEGEERVNPIEDMVCLCANCHRAVHHDRKQTLSIDELKDRIKQHSKTKEDSI